MTIKELNKSKVPIVTINPKLEKYKNKVLFQDKLDDVNEFLDRVGLPDSMASKNLLPAKPLIPRSRKKNGRVSVRKNALPKADI